MLHNLEVSLTFQLCSPLHTTGERAELWVDKALLLDPHRRCAIIAATTIKGWLRESVERWLRGMAIPICDGSQAETLCGSCLVCQLFGHPYQRALLRFYDVPLEDALRDVRMNVSLSRYRRASYEQRLFATEVAWHWEFACRITGLFADRQLAEIAAALLCLGARCGFAIGAARSRGLGWLNLVGSECKVDGHILDFNRLQNKLADLIQGKQGVVS